MDEMEKSERDEIYSNVVRAGQRTYFFDVRTNRQQDGYYLTITESKKRYLPNGETTYQKHKVFLYQEDFEKFKDAMVDAFEKIIDLNRQRQIKKSEEGDISDYSNVDFDGLGETETVISEQSSPDKG